MQKLKRFHLSGFWLVSIAGIIWGTIGVATKAIYTTDQTSPLFINLMRTVIATPILAAICWRMMGRKMFEIQARDLRVVIVTGCFLVLSQLSYFASIQYIGVTIATVLTLCVSPVIVVILSVALKTERFTKHIAIPLALAIVGCILLVGIAPESTATVSVPIGFLLAFASAACYACMIMGGRFLSGRYHPLQVTSIGFAAGTVLLLLISLGSEMNIASSPTSWMIVLYLGLIPTAIAYWLFQTGLASVDATTASIVIMLEPLVATFLAFFMFGETLSISGIIGSILLIVSLFLLSTRKPDTKN